LDLQRDLIVGKGFCRRAARSIDQRLDALWDNDDDDTLKVADTLLGVTPSDE
jgi:hypothetical protein